MWRILRTAMLMLIACLFATVVSAADLTITAANLIPVAGYNAESQFLAGATITRGQTVYLDTSTNTWKLADCDLSAAAAGSAGFGISLSDAVSGQPMFVQTDGDLGFGAILTVGQIYCISATAGGICPYGDLTTNGRVTIIGVASTTSNLKFRKWASGIVKP